MHARVANIALGKSTAAIFAIGRQSNIQSGAALASFAGAFHDPCLICHCHSSLRIYMQETRRERLQRGGESARTDAEVYFRKVPGLISLQVSGLDTGWRVETRQALHAGDGCDRRVYPPYF